MLEVGGLNGVIGVKGVGNPVFMVVVGTSYYLHFISYALTLVSFCTNRLYLMRLSSCIMLEVWGNVHLNIGSISCVVGNVADDVGWSVCRGINCRVGCSVSCSIGSGIDRLHYFIFTSFHFSNRLKGTLTVTLLATTFRSAPGVGTCCGSAVPRASFFNLCRGDIDVVGGLGRPERLLSCFVESCRLQGRHVQSP
jgi:hypothetical protein